MPKITESQGPSFEEGREPTQENGVESVPRAVREAIVRPGEHGNYRYKNVGGIKSERGSHVGDLPGKEDSEWDGNSSSASTDSDDESNDETGNETGDHQSTAHSAGGSSKDEQATSTASSTGGKKALRRKPQ
jgi:hypothetical protein